MNLFWAVIIITGSVIAGTTICYWSLHRTRDVVLTHWLLEHILCPIVRVIVLLIVVSQVYPVLDQATTSTDFWRILSQQGQFKHLLNILFFAGLAISFIPLLNHPALALPLQSGLTIALVFHWQYEDPSIALQLFPSAGTLLQILIYMLVAYYGTHRLSTHLSRWIDQQLVISGSIRLVSEAIFLLLQVPAMLFYCSFLKLQLP